MVVITFREKRMGLHFPVHVRGQDTGGALVTETTRSLNVSGGGICFETQRQYPIGAHIVVHIKLPNRIKKHFQGRPIYKVRAVVCRIEHSDGQPVYKVSARFLSEIGVSGRR